MVYLPCLSAKNSFLNLFYYSLVKTYVTLKSPITSYCQTIIKFNPWDVASWIIENTDVPLNWNLWNSCCSISPFNTALYLWLSERSRKFEFCRYITLFQFKYDAIVPNLFKSFWISRKQLYPHNHIQMICKYIAVIRIHGTCCENSSSLKVVNYFRKRLQRRHFQGSE